MKFLAMEVKPKALAFLNFFLQDHWEGQHGLLRYSWIRCCIVNSVIKFEFLFRTDTKNDKQKLHVIVVPLPNYALYNYFQMLVRAYSQVYQKGNGEMI